MADRVSALLDVSHPRRVLLISGAHGVNEFYSIALPPILPLLVTDLNITYAEAGLLVTVFFVMYTVFQLPAGFVADRVSKRLLIVLGTVGLAVGTFLASTAGDYLTLVGAQVVAGVSGSTYHPAGMSMISDLESGDTEGKAMGLHGAGGVAGTLLAPVVIGGLATVADWRFALAASAGVGIAYAVVFGVFFSDPIPRAANGSGRQLVPGPVTPSALVRRLRQRLEELGTVLLTAWVLGLVFGKFIVALQFGSVRTFTPSYIFAVGGGSEAISNAVFFVLLAGGGVSVVWFGNLSDRFDRERLLWGSLVLSGVLLLVTRLIPPNPWILVVWFFVIGGAVFASGPVINTLTSEYSQRGFSGSLFGLTQTASALGSAAGPLVFGIIATRYGMPIAFPAIAAVPIVGGLVLLLGSGRLFR